eukprot:3524695-Rhodomonas_salina.1
MIARMLMQPVTEPARARSCGDAGADFSPSCSGAELVLLKKEVIEGLRPAEERREWRTVLARTLLWR